MILVEKHIIKRSNSFYREIDHACFLGKNLYNSALYAIRQHFFETKKYLSKFELINRFTKESQKDYVALPRKVSQQVIYNVDQNFKSFFNSLKSKNIHHRVNIPAYKDKVKGRQVLTYTNQAISHKELKKGYLQLSGLNFRIKIQHTNIQQVRVIKRTNCYVIEVLYKIDDPKQKEFNHKIAAIDLGINNLATVSSNVIQPFIINGRPLKSINQFYNKKLAELKSEADKSKRKHFNENKIIKLTYKRNNKVNDYLHKASRVIVNYLVFNDIRTLVIGHNKEWKQETNMRKKNNQNFVQIPHSRFIDLLKYKCQLEGINVITQEESYTSKCSFFDGEIPCKHDSYKGKRIKRGLFRTSKGRIINADVNGSLNIMIKAIPNAFDDQVKRNGIEACNRPCVLNVYSGVKEFTTLKSFL